MVKILFAALLFFSDDASAGLGRALSQDQVFDQMCLLDFGADRERYTEICTGVLIDQTTVLTAAHCVEQGLPQAIVCGPQARRVEFTSFELHPNFTARWSVGNVSYLKNDIAILKLAQPVPAEEIPLMSMKSLNQIHQCAFFGFSKLSMTSRTSQTAYQLGWEIDRSSLDFWDELGMIRMQGLKAGGGLSEVGDSGGPLMCREKSGPWRLLGVASSRDFAYQAYFTPVMTEGFPVETTAGSLSLRAEAQSLKAKKSATAYRRMFSELIENIRRIPKIAALADQAGTTLSYQELYQMALRELFDRPGMVGRLRAYSTFKKVGDPKQYSVGDLAFNYFTVDKMDFHSGYAEGTLKVLGPSENFMCHGDLLCRDETIRHVRTKIENLLIFLK